MKRKEELKERKWSSVYLKHLDRKKPHETVEGETKLDNAQQRAEGRSLTGARTQILYIRYHVEDGIRNIELSRFGSIAAC